MTRRAAILVSLFFAVVLSACAEESESVAADRHPIDIAMEEAMEANSSTMGMVAAVTEAQSKWAQEIETALKQLHEEVEAEAWKALELSQRAWTVYRDNETVALREFYSQMPGSMWRLASASSVMAIHRARAIQLKEYLEALETR